MIARVCAACGEVLGAAQARNADGEYMHTRCASLDEQRRFQRPETREVVAYLSMSGRAIVTWPGGHLADVTKARHVKTQTPLGLPCDVHHVWARDDLGRTWYGRNAGPGMLIRLRRTKAGDRA